MLKKNDKVVLNIVGMSKEGFGVARYSDEKLKDFVIFVSGTAIGDTAEILIVKVLKNFAFGKVLALKNKSADRQETDCPTFGKCGGCCFRHITYEAELKYKKSFVEDVFKKNYPTCPVSINDPIPSDNLIRYRNKAQFPFSQNGRCGYFAVNSHRVIEAEDCLLTDPVFSEISRIVENHISKYDIPLYNEITAEGLFRHLYIRKAHATGEIMVMLVVNGETFPHKTQLIEDLTEIEAIKSIFLNVNTTASNVILSPDCILLWGKESITDILCGLKFEISPLSFYQVNSETCEKLYNYVKDGLCLNKEDTLLDLYCGIGTIGLSMADKVKNLIGIEAVEQAVMNASKNADINNVKNAVFYYATASETLQILNKHPEKAFPNVVIVDPPRKGLDIETINAILKIKPEKFAYISCDPATLARDLQILETEGGYTPTSVQPFDMFPRTKHVETVVLMSK